MMIFDARLITAFGLFVVGVILISGAVKMWATHPVNRVFTLGQYVTEEGLRLVLNNWIIVFTFGVTALAEAAGRVAYWAQDKGLISPGITGAIGVLEAGFTVWAMICTIRAAWSVWRG